MFSEGRQISKAEILQFEVKMVVFETKIVKYQTKLLVVVILAKTAEMIEFSSNYTTKQSLASVAIPSWEPY